MSRHIFRLTYYKNIAQFLEDGVVLAKNHQPMQKCFQTSYSNIVARRGSSEFDMPCGSVLNDFVPFYFSPITAMASAIHHGKVDLNNPAGEAVGIARPDEIVFLVSNTQSFENARSSTYFTNVACNSKAELPKFENDLDLLDSHIKWSLFDESPMKAKITEVGYHGVCRYFLDRDDGAHGNRSAQRMAEFLVKDRFSLSDIDCIVTQNDTIRATLEKQIQESHWNVPVYTKPDCYF